MMKAAKTQLMELKEEEAETDEKAVVVETVAQTAAEVEVNLEAATAEENLEVVGEDLEAAVARSPTEAEVVERPTKKGEAAFHRTGEG